MSAEDVTARKAKKAQRDAERKKAGKKRKREDVEEEQKDEGKDELKDDFISLAGGDETKVAKDSKTLSKKRKSADTSEVAQESAPNKRRKSKPTASALNGDAADTEVTKTADDAPTTKATKSRFILFIGNLPYTATDASITAHFKSIQPFTLRHRVDPKTKKSKGFAFLEFENYDRMKTCLKLYHHSTFDPKASGEVKVKGGGDSGQQHPERAAAAVAGGRRKKDKSRRINVELTAGGGGKGEERKTKIKEKNVRLEEQRKRRREAEEKEAVRKEKKMGMGRKRTGANAATAAVGRDSREGKVVVGDGVEADGNGGRMEGVHPARLARMKT